MNRNHKSPHQNHELHKTRELAQVCLNGHLITPIAYHFPETRRLKCEQCSEDTLSHCLSCNASIPGWDFTLDWDVSYVVPNFCWRCNQPHPWLRRAMRNTLGLYSTLLIGTSELAVLKADLIHLFLETSRSAIAAMRTRELLYRVDGFAWARLRKILRGRVSGSALVFFVDL